ncbi:MAG: hypothetical protein AAGI11_15200 [Pseudomonadota bacterium]
MHEDREFIIGVGYKGVSQAYGLNASQAQTGGAFSGSHHRPKGQPGGGRFRTKACRIHASESMRTGFSKPLLASGQALTGIVHRYIAELKPYEQNWLSYCYRGLGPAQAASGSRFFRAYVPLFEAMYMKGASATTKERVHDMILFRMQQEAGLLPDWVSYRDVSGTDISKQLWHQTFAARWEEVCSDLHRVDESTLYKIGVKLNVN